MADRRFTVYIERDVWIGAMSDTVAAQVADYIDAEITATIKRISNTVEIVHARTTCHRGESNKMVYDSQDEAVA